MGKRFGDFRIRGRSYRLGHLAPLLLSATTDAFPRERVKLLVTFASHCWSEGLRKGVHTPDLAFTDEAGRRRAFSAARHADTFALAEAFSGAWSLEARRTPRRNFLVVVPVPGGDLHAFASLATSRQRKADVHCLVQTAYRPASPARHLGPPCRLSDAVDAALGHGGTDHPYAWLGELADEHALIG